VGQDNYLFSKTNYIKLSTKTIGNFTKILNQIEILS